MTLPLRTRKPTGFQLEGSPNSGSALLLKTAGLLSLSVLLWVNFTSNPKGFPLISPGATDAALSLPRKLDATSINSNSSLKPLLRSDQHGPSALLQRNNLPSIVTFVDTRKSDYVIKTDPLRTSSNNNTSKKVALPPPKTVTEGRIHYLHACGADRIDDTYILDMVKQVYRPPDTSTLSISTTPSETTSSIQPCQYTFLDLGANVGDSLGKFIDSGWENCQQPGTGTTDHKYSPKYNLMEGILDQFYDNDNVLVRFARHFTRKAGRKGKAPSRYPEEYCYYGLEGNPVFTPRLKVLQERVMQTTPRPVQSAHFFTETVGAGVDGPSVLYLDTISKKNNFWGSSVLTQPKYVRESAERHNDGKPIEAKVQGMTLSTLIKKTSLREEGGHLLIKVDIEGGEFAVFQEVHRSGVLCDYTARGVVVNILVEKHAPQFQAAGLDNALWDKFMQDLTKCGVIIQGGGSAGR